MAVPQIDGMYKGDRARKIPLVEYGFRLPSALDNRPLTFAEWDSMIGQIVYVSATPGPYEEDRVPRSWWSRSSARPAWSIPPSR